MIRQEKILLQLDRRFSKLKHVLLLSNRNAIGCKIRPLTKFKISDLNFQQFCFVQGEIVVWYNRGDLIWIQQLISKSGIGSVDQVFNRNRTDRSWEHKERVSRLHGLKY